MASKLERLVMIEKRIRAGKYPSVDELCELFEIKRRTLYLDIRELREKLGLDVRFDKARRGYYLGSPGRELPEFNLTDDEYITLVIGQRMLCHFGGPSFEALSVSALEKVADFSPLIEPDLHLPQIAFSSEPGAISFSVFLDLFKS